MTDIILSTQNGEPVASSRQIAESFGKDHNHVMRDIKALEEGVSKNGQTPMFFKTEYTHEQNRLFVWMREHGYLIKDPKRSDYNMPTQRAVEQGLFEIKETTVVHSDGHTSINKTPKVTGKGQIYFVNLFLKGRDPAGTHQRKEVEA